MMTPIQGRSTMVLAACLLWESAHAAVSREHETKLIRAVQKGDVVLPALPAGLSPRSAGCLVIGHHVVAGKSEKPRMMKGAFTANVDAGQQQAFAAAAIEAAGLWQFEPVATGPDAGASGLSFRMETVGFLHAADGRAHVAIGVDNQHARLRDSCRVDDLAAWGEQNAVPVELARERNGDKVMLKQAGESAYFWTAAKMPPPHYPPDALMADIGACVLVGFMVGEDGSVRDVRLMAAEYNSTPARPVRMQLQAASAFAAAHWRFSPGPDNLGRIPEFMQVPLTFQPDRIRWKPRGCVPLDLHALTPTAK